MTPFASPATGGRSLVLAAALLAAGSAAADVIVVTANPNRTFTPSSVDARPGDTVRFMLPDGGFHSVRQTASANSCTALPGGFNSGACNSVPVFNLVIPANASGSIFYMCECHCATGMRGRINVVPACNAANVSQDPQDATGCTGGEVTFSVQATGTAPFTYQWRHDNADIAGATSPQLVLSGLSAASAGSYDCTVTNACGSDTSAAATLSICGADFNCDGFLDFFDYDDFVGAFESGDPRADYNGDGFADFFDYDDYIAAFEQGC